MERDTDVLDLSVGIMVKNAKVFCFMMDKYGILLGDAKPCEFLLSHSVKTFARKLQNTQVKTFAERA